jgi:hypothetical protein
MATTTRLPRVSPPWTPTAAAPDPGFGPGVIAGYDAPTNIANVASPIADAADVAEAAKSASAEAEAEAEAGAADAANPAEASLATAPAQPFSDLVRTLLQQQRRRLAIGAAGVVALATLLALPPVWAQVRDSFVRKPEPYTALYFTTPPQVDGTVLTVPVSVHAAETGSTAYSVRVWTVDAQGHVDDTRDAALKWDGQALSAVVSMPVNPAASFVWVSLGGSNETLHYKIAVA